MSVVAEEARHAPVNRGMDRRNSGGGHRGRDDRARGRFSRVLVAPLQGSAPARAVHARSRKSTTVGAGGNELSSTRWAAGPSSRSGGAVSLTCWLWHFIAAPRAAASN